MFHVKPSFIESRMFAAPGMMAVNKDGNLEEVQDGVTGFHAGSDSKAIAQRYRSILDERNCGMGTAGLDQLRREVTCDKIVLGFEYYLQKL